MKHKIMIVVFDMDGVLVDFDSSWQYIHEAFNVSNKDNLERYLRGEIDYREFMRRDILLWGDVHIDQIRNLLSKVPLMKGAREVIDRLKKAGYGTCIISAGISILADRLKEELGIDYLFANKLVVDANGMLIGEGQEVVDLLNKVDVLERLLLEVKVSPDCCAIVGDSAFDIPLFEECGFSIAFNTKDKRVKDAADVVIKGKDLRKILPYFSIAPCLI